MPPRPGGFQTGSFGVNVFDQARNILRRANIFETHAQKFFPGVPVMNYGGLIDLNEAQRLQVIKPHRQRIVEKEQPELGLALALLFLGSFAVSNVPADTED